MTSSPTTPQPEPGRVIDEAIADAERSHRDELGLLRLIAAIQLEASKRRVAAQHADDDATCKAETAAANQWEVDALAELDGAA